MISRESRNLNTHERMQGECIQGYQLYSRWLTGRSPPFTSHSPTTHSPVCHSVPAVPHGHGSTESAMIFAESPVHTDMCLFKSPFILGRSLAKRRVAYLLDFNVLIRRKAGAIRQ